MRPLAEIKADLEGKLVTQAEALNLQLPLGAESDPRALATVLCLGRVSLTPRERMQSREQIDVAIDNVKLSKEMLRRGHYDAALLAAREAEAALEGGAPI